MLFSTTDILLKRVKKEKEKEWRKKFLLYWSKEIIVVLILTYIVYRR